jgi:hypothetical protein
MQSQFVELRILLSSLCPRLVGFFASHFDPFRTQPLGHSAAWHDLQPALKWNLAKRSLNLACPRQFQKMAVPDPSFWHRMCFFHFIQGRPHSFYAGNVKGVIAWTPLILPPSWTVQTCSEWFIFLEQTRCFDGARDTGSFSGGSWAGTWQETWPKELALA